MMHDNKTLCRLEVKHFLFCLEGEREVFTQKYFEAYRKWRNQFDLSLMTPEDRELNKDLLGEYDPSKL